jgi:hypothetical protein
MKANMKGQQNPSSDKLESPQVQQPFQKSEEKDKFMNG